MDYANFLSNISKTKTMHTGTRASCCKTEKLSLNRIFLASVGCLFKFVISITYFRIPSTAETQYYTTTIILMTAFIRKNIAETVPGVKCFEGPNL